MPFKRSGRRTFSFQAKTRDGTFRQLSTWTADKNTAKDIERLWNRLASERAWDVLDPVLQRERTIGILLDADRAARGKLSDLRRLLQDVNLCPLVDNYLEHYAASGRRLDTLQHVTFALRWLLPADGCIRVSQASASWLAAKLASYPASPSTRRKVRSEWNGFFRWLCDVKQLLDASPMDRVRAPAQSKPRIGFYELQQVERIVGYQPTEERRALMALLYGTGIEVSTSLTVLREDIDSANKMVRARGTKAHTRDRLVRVDDWSWAIFWPFVKTRISGKIFSVASRHTVSNWHAQTLSALAIAPRLPLKNARHHWAATHLRAGAPIGLVQQQLGHSTPMLTLSTYGLFIPTSQDHDRLQTALRAREEIARSAVGGAK